MEEEIDLREYVEVLVRNWVWIGAAGLLAALAAFVVSSLMAPTYEASAVVMITEPQYQMQFDPRFETAEWSPAYQAFPTLATSDDLLGRVVEQYTPSPEAGIEEWRLGALSGMVEASSEGDPSLLVLRVSSRAPRDAASIANAWADVLTERGNEIYGGGEENVDFFEARVSEAKESLDEAESALIEFEARNQANIFSTELESLQQTQSDYLSAQRSIAYLIQDIRSLRRQLSQTSSTTQTTVADDLTALFLQVKAFSTEAPVSIQLQVDDAEALSDKSAEEQVVFLDELIDTLDEKSVEIEEKLGGLEPEMLSLQRQIQEIEAEKSELTQARDLVRETHVTLARKLEEARIAAQEESGVLKIGSYAQPPERPAGPRRMMNTALAGAVGLMVGVFGVFALEWWKDGERAS